jgi:hypothetical protein
MRTDEQLQREVEAEVEAEQARWAAEQARAGDPAEQARRAAEVRANAVAVAQARREAEEARLAAAAEAEIAAQSAELARSMDAARVRVWREGQRAEAEQAERDRVARVRAVLARAVGPAPSVPDVGHGATGPSREQGAFDEGLLTVLRVAMGLAIAVLMVMAIRGVWAWHRPTVGDCLLAAILLRMLWPRGRSSES